jgi:ATP-dependent 26S proteasome regulatory subunit
MHSIAEFPLPDEEHREHLVRAMARQMLKQGRIPFSSDFRHYFALLSQE